MAPDLVPLVLCGMRDKFVEGDIDLVLRHIKKGKEGGSGGGGKGAVSLRDQPTSFARLLGNL